MEPYLSTGEGLPLLLLHSSLSSKYQWSSLIKSLPEGITATSIDLLGYGYAPMPTEEGIHQLETEVRWLDEFWQPTELGCLIGHSYGGAVAMAWALMYPQKIKAIALYEPVLFGLLDKNSSGWQEVETLSEKIAAHLEQGEQWQAAVDFIDYWSGAGAFSFMPEALQQEVVKGMTKVVKDFEAITQLNFSLDTIADAPFKIYLMSGEHSRHSAHQVVNVLAKVRPDAERVQFPKMGHMGPVMCASKVNKKLIEWFLLTNL